MELSVIQNKLSVFKITNKKRLTDYFFANSKITNLYLLFLFHVHVLFSGCNPNDICLSNQHALQANFFSMENKNRIIVPGTTIFGIGMSNDSIYKDEDVAAMFLPLSFEKDTTSFVIIRQSVLKDTIYFVYSKKLSFISRNCGFTFDFKLDTVFSTGLFIDSVSIVYPIIKYNENFENVEIYIY